MAARYNPSPGIPSGVRRGTVAGLAAAAAAAAAATATAAAAAAAKTNGTATAVAATPAMAARTADVDAAHPAAADVDIGAARPAASSGRNSPLTAAGPLNSAAAGAGAGGADAGGAAAGASAGAGAGAAPGAAPGAGTGAGAVTGAGAGATAGAGAGVGGGAGAGASVGCGDGSVSGSSVDEAENALVLGVGSKAASEVSIVAPPSFARRVVLPNEPGGHVAIDAFLELQSDIFPVHLESLSIGKDATIKQLADVGRSQLFRRMCIVGAQRSLERSLDSPRALCAVSARIRLCVER
eukprot:379038-Pleurochrysis_carterae.AAC.2